MTDFKARVKKLSAYQRSSLASRLTDSITRGKRTRLVAYLVANKGFEEQNLRAYLAQHLPDYMLPREYLCIDVLPRNKHGKIDRGALLQLQKKPDAAVELSNDDLQNRLSAVWCEVLDMEYIRPDDDYFELGGDSISSIQIISRAAKQGMDFTPADLMEHSTIRELADYLSEKVSNAESVKSSEPDDAAQTADDEDLDDILRILNLEQSGQ